MIQADTVFRHDLHCNKSIYHSTNQTTDKIMKILGTDFIMFSVSDLRKAVEFYCDDLGLACDIFSQENQWAELDCGNVTLSLHGNSLKSPEKGHGQIAFAVEDVMAAYKNMKDRGLNVLEKPADYGVCKAFRMLDPDGNLVILHKRADGTHGQG